MRMIRLRNIEAVTIQVIIPAERPKKFIDKSKPINKVITPIILVLRLLL
ncbi:hypothetical protein C7448_101492 [Tenacibaculum gallaicum]|uniref:Uncharacterized protein n=1 Tax=Tenacibaculum gallaicum TaxID=561505 RepID=A0A3E0ICZ7_9FLAO|nr:hypothetical protein C7448_101492 [Tenacibaculum gallaicum]